MCVKDANRKCAASQPLQGTAARPPPPQATKFASPRGPCGTPSGGAPRAHVRDVRDSQLPAWPGGLSSWAHSASSYTKDAFLCVMQLPVSPVMSECVA